MRAYFSGSHSTGKSTLARHVSKQYSLPLVFESSRQILSEQELQIDSLRCDLDVADRYQQQVFDRQLSEEQKYSSFVSDRSIIDILAYSGQHTRILPRLMRSPQLLQYINELRHQFIFFVRPSQAILRPDGVRESLDWNGIVAIDAQIKLLYRMFDLPYIQISTDSMQERVLIIDSVLSRLNK